MNRRPILPTALAGLCLLALTACPRDRDEGQPGGFNRGTATTPATPAPQATPRPTPTPKPRVEEPTPPPAPTAPPQNAPVDYPYATPVPGKQGYVISPYAPDAGYVDVRGMSPGQQARDPYTQKIFLVP